MTGELYKKNRSVTNFLLVGADNEAKTTNSSLVTLHILYNKKGNKYAHKTKREMERHNLYQVTPAVVHYYNDTYALSTDNLFTDTVDPNKKGTGKMTNLLEQYKEIRTNNKLINKTIKMFLLTKNGAYYQYIETYRNPASKRETQVLVEYDENTLKVLGIE